jgi:hypothetical protein
MKAATVKHIIDIHKNIIPKPDVAGSYYQYPVQSILSIIKNGRIDLSIASKFKLTKNDFKEDKEFPTIVLTQLTSKAYKYNFLVSIRVGRKYPTDFGFNTFEEANDLYIKLVYENELTNDTYTIYRYNQLIENKVPEYDYNEYMKLITTDVNNL